MLPENEQCRWDPFCHPSYNSVFQISVTPNGYTIPRVFHVSLVLFAFRHCCRWLFCFSSVARVHQCVSLWDFLAQLVFSQQKFGRWYIHFLLVKQPAVVMRCGGGRWVKQARRALISVARAPNPADFFSC